MTVVPAPPRREPAFFQSLPVAVERQRAADVLRQAGHVPEPGQIPKDDASCTRESYVEGAVGLAKTGCVLRDAAGTHQLEKID